MPKHLVPAVLAFVTAVVAVLGLGVSPARAVAYTPITENGSSWAFNAIDTWRKDVVSTGIKVNDGQDGSVVGLTNFANGSLDFAGSDIPYGVPQTSPDPPGRGFAYIPDVAGGTALMYNLNVNGQRFTNLKLSGDVIAQIFSGAITQWNNPKIAAENPGVALPPLKITPVVRSDGSGSTAQFTLWMKTMFPSQWSACGEVSFFTQCSYYKPTVQQAKSGDNGVAGFVSQASNQGSIGYVEYSYALQSGYPVAKVLNQAGYYVLPTASNVAVALLQAKINNTASDPKVYLTQELNGVYTDKDMRSYPISSYSYFVVPTALQNGFTNDKGATLSAFVQYALCEGQQAAPTLGYSPLPINLVQAGLAQVKKIPGAQIQNINIKSCNNPTFSTSGVNTLATTALYPDKCDAKAAAGGCVYGTPAKGTVASSTSGQGDNNKVGNHASGSTSTGSTSTATAPSSGTGSATTGTGGKSASSGGASSTGGTAGSAGSGTDGGTLTLTNPDGRTTCDPDTGQCTQLVASPVEVPNNHGATFSRWAVVLVIVALLGVIIVPPALVLATRRRNR